MLNLRQVESLIAVIEAGGFHEAARRLGRSQPTLTQHIQKLEDELGKNLLVRGGGDCRLTREGEIFLPYARSLIRTVERAKAALSGGRPLIGASGNIGTYLLPPLLAAHAAAGAALPEVTIGPNPSIADRLERGEVDLAMMEWWDGREGFVPIPWRREPLIVITPLTHPWRCRESIDGSELLGERMIGGEPGTGTGRLLAEALGAVARELKVEMSLDNTEAVKNAVRCGLGISIVMAATVAEDVRTGTLHGVAIRDVSLEKELLAIVPESLAPESPAAAFLSLLRHGAGSVRPERFSPSRASP